MSLMRGAAFLQHQRARPPGPLPGLWSSAHPDRPGLAFKLCRSPLNMEPAGQEASGEFTGFPEGSEAPASSQPKPARRGGRGSAAQTVILPEIKLEIVIEALRGVITQGELSRKHGVSQPLISFWKREALEVLRRHFVDKEKQDSGGKTDKRDEFFDNLDLQSISRFPSMLRDVADVLDRVSREAPKKSSGGVERKQ